MRLLLIAFLAFALSGCWVGTNLYAPSDSRPAIPPGAYKVTARGEPAQVSRISLLPNGLTQFDDGDEKEVYGFAPLGTDGTTFVAWENAKPDPAVPVDPKAKDQMYALVVRQPNGEFLVYALSCFDTAAEIARKSGATIEPGISPTCRFPTRASLESALRQVPRDAAAMKLTPIR